NVSVTTSACSAKKGVSKENGYTITRIPAWNFFEEKLGAPFPIFSPSLLWKSYKAVKNADIVHVHDAFYATSLAAAVWAAVLRRPMVVTQHVDLIPHPKAIVRLAQKLVYATTGSFILRTAKKVIYLNSRVSEFLASLGVKTERLQFLPNGHDMNAFAPVTARQKIALRKKYGLPEDKKLALFVGRFVPKKGFRKLMELPLIDGLDIVFVGGKKPSDCKTNVNHHFLGSIERADIPDIYRLADIFVLPSRGEGFPMTIQEAMASSLAVVTTNDPAYDIYGLKDDQIILIEPTRANLIATLQALKDDYSRCQALAKNASDYAHRVFSSHINTNKLVALYKEVLE
ncbi:MAG TPA: glycosyltransferase family 4 protein, partial [Candidatus Saccharimonadales bacterium]